jgi:CheY-like chemotaxis protein
VVLVEDNADVREMMRDLLVLLGHEVATAEDGLRGLELVRGWGADVALVDVGLPGLDGYELARRARSGGGGGLPCLVALTGYGQAGDRRKALAAGFDEHLVKPADLERLRAVLREARERRRARGEGGGCGPA